MADRVQVALGVGQEVTDYRLVVRSISGDRL